MNQIKHSMHANNVKSKKHNIYVYVTLYCDGLSFI